MILTGDLLLGYTINMFVRSVNKQSIRSRAPVEATDATAVRQHNASLLLHLIWGAQQVSRADLARQTGLSRSTVSAIVTDLIETGLVAESHVARSSGGRPPIVLRMCDEAFSIIGVELGASHITVVLTDLRGRILQSEACHFDVESDPQGTLEHLHTMVEGLQRPKDTIMLGAGLAVPSPLDPSRPGLLSDRILPAWAGVRPAQALEQQLSMPVLMENDANLGALSELIWGAGRDVSHFAYIKVATGVGAGIIIEGEIFQGATGIAGEVGHTSIDPNGPRCRCGLFGCLEAMVGSRSLVQKARLGLADEPDSILAASPQTISLHQIVAAAQAGDALALGIIEEAGRHLGVATANLVNLLNPARVVLGGTLAKAGELLIAPLRTTQRSRALSSSVDETTVSVSTLGSDAIALGAATLVLRATLAHPTSFPVKEPGRGSPVT